ncbi:MAG: response regulator [Clostridia bacterium]|nr:response regulator [Clostridia bacterium]
MQVLCILDSIDLLKKIKHSCQGSAFVFKTVTPMDNINDYCNQLKPDAIIMQDQYDDVSVTFLTKSLSQNPRFNTSIKILVAKDDMVVTQLMDFATQHQMLLVDEHALNDDFCAKMTAMVEEQRDDTPIKPSHLERIKQILYVSDNRFMHIIIKDAFLNNAIELIDAYDADEAIEKLKTHLPDLVMTDIDIPGLSGIDLCKSIKHSAALSHIPVVIYSSYEKDEVWEACSKVGASDYFEKNINPKDLVIKLKSYL